MTGTMLRGDSFDHMMVAPAASADAFVMDPPYGVDYRGRWGSGARVHNDAGLAWLFPVASQVARVLKPDAFCVCFYGWPYAGLFLAAFAAFDMAPVSHLVFVKNQMGLGYATRGIHEQAYLFAKGSPKPQAVLPDVLPWTRVRGAYHPTQKPVDAIEACVARFSPPGGVVWDPFAGSGTTGEACANLGRSFVGVEYDPKHFAYAKARVARAYARTAGGSSATRRMVARARAAKGARAVVTR